MRQLPFAKDLPYWRTSSSSVETWLEKIRRLILAADGDVISEAFADQQGNRAFLFEFDLAGERFRVTWPVCQISKDEELRAAKVQAVTMVYHDLKARIVTAKVIGAKRALLSYLLIGGRTAGDIAEHFDPDSLPRLLTGPVARSE